MGAEEERGKEKGYKKEGSGREEGGGLRSGPVALKKVKSEGGLLKAPGLSSGQGIVIK